MIQAAKILSFLLLTQVPSPATGRVWPLSSGSRQQEKSLEALLADLERGNKLAVRERALMAIARLGPAAEEAVPALIRTLRNKRLRMRSMTALAAMAEAAQDAIPSLKRYLESRDPELRSAAQDSLMAIGFDAVPYIAKDIASVKYFRRAAAKLALLGERAKPAVPNLVSVLVYFPTEDRRLLQHKKLMERWLQKIKRANERRLVALDTLSHMGAAKRGAFAAFKRVIYHKDRKIAELAIRCLASCGDMAVPPLSRAIKRMDYPHKDLALIALASFGPAAKKAVPQLEKLSNKATGKLQSLALNAILTVEGGLRLTEQTRSKDAKERKIAALRLADYGEVASVDLLHALRDKDLSIRDAILDKLESDRRFATERFARGKPEAAPWPPRPVLPRRAFIPYLSEVLEGTDVGAAIKACRILDTMGGKERFAAFGALLRACRRKEATLRRAALQALLSFDRRDRQSVAALGGLMPGRPAEFRLRILAYLAQIGRAARPASAELIASLRFADKRVREAASKILLRSRLTNELAAALGSKDPAQRMAVARCLAAFGRKARSALENLRAALETEKDPATKEALQSAIVSIEKA